MQKVQEYYVYNNLQIITRNGLIATELELPH